MAKFNLIIADNDKDYMNALSDYLISNYYNEFQVSCFSKERLLLEFLLDSNTKVDVLLISSDMFSKKFLNLDINTVIVMSNGVLEGDYGQVPVINKYRTGEKIACDVLSIFSEKNPHKTLLKNSEKQTKIIGVYSPIGGAGKTTISTICALELAKKGFNVFYLNLEDIQSISLYFNCDVNRSLSKILLYIKQKNKNVNIKIDGIKMTDEKYSNLSYFSPIENAFDYEDMSKEDISYLIEQLKEQGIYDVIIIDMSSEFNSKNIGVFSQCDNILCAVMQNKVSEIKIQSMFRDFHIVSQIYKFEIDSKIDFIINKYKINKASKIEDIIIDSGKNIICKIPNLGNELNNRDILENNSALSNSIINIIDLF